MEPSTASGDVLVRSLAPPTVTAAKRHQFQATAVRVAELVPGFYNLLPLLECLGEVRRRLADLVGQYLLFRQALRKPHALPFPCPSAAAWSYQRIPSHCEYTPPKPEEANGVPQR